MKASSHHVLLFAVWLLFSLVCGSPLKTSDSTTHRNSESDSADERAWDTLYDKEIGTWCEPSDDAKTSSITEQLGTRTNREPQKRQHHHPAAAAAARPPLFSESNAVVTRWVDAALRVVRAQTLSAHNCSSDELWCDGPTKTTRPVPSTMNLYVALPDKHRHHKMEAVLPDGALTKTGAHDAWIVLDPTPHLAFGHTVYVFVVDFNTSDISCIATGGIPLEGDECLNQVFKNRCPNRMVRRAASANWHQPRHRISLHRCDVDYVPLVHWQNRPPLQNEQRLLCSNDIVNGFAACPPLRSWNETSELICDPLSVNHKRCDSTQDVVKTRCRLFETCDQAVLLSGGWNWQWSSEREVRRLLSVYRMLRHNGFDKHSIKIFFANGARARIRGAELQLDHVVAQEMAHKHDDEEEDPFSFQDLPPPALSTDEKQHRHAQQQQQNERPAMYPAALKIGMRNHIRTLCTTPHCADSLVIYLSSPTRSDGASILWDADNNGEFDETEVYTIREFLRDIQDCVARQVVVLVDQNHSGLLADTLKRSKRHSNVLMFTSGQSNQLSHVGEFTHHWAHYAHGHACLSQAFKDSVGSVRHSTTRFEDSSNGTLAFNLFGAPCDAVPPYSSYELKSLYMGCQYVPTRMWLSRPGSDIDPPPRLLTGR